LGKAYSLDTVDMKNMKASIPFLWN